MAKGVIDQEQITAIQHSSIRVAQPLYVGICNIYLVGTGIYGGCSFAEGPGKQISHFFCSLRLSRNRLIEERGRYNACASTQDMKARLPHKDSKTSDVIT